MAEHSAGEAAEQHSEQKRNPGRLQHRAGAIAMGDVPDFVTDDAGQFVGGMYAEAYFESDPWKLVEAGLKCVPTGIAHGTVTIKPVTDSVSSMSVADEKLM